MSSWSDAHGRFDDSPRSFSITAENPSELNSTAFLKGERLMHAARTLIDDDTMRIVQTVYLPDGTAPSNRSVYFREP